MTVSSPECSCFLQFARACIFSLETMERTILPISIFRRSLWFSNKLIVSFITGTQMAPWKLSQACVKSTELLISCQAGNAHAEMRSLSAGDISSWHNECNQVLHQNAWQYVHVPKDSSLLKFKNITGIIKAQFKIHHYGVTKCPKLKLVSTNFLALHPSGAHHVKCQQFLIIIKTIHDIALQTTADLNLNFKDLNCELSIPSNSSHKKCHRALWGLSVPQELCSNNL